MINERFNLNIEREGSMNQLVKFGGYFLTWSIRYDKNRQFFLCSNWCIPFLNRKVNNSILM